MSFMTGASRVMLGGMGEHPFAFFIPIILTIILLFNHNVSFSNKKFVFTLVLIVIWSVIQIIVRDQYTAKSYNNYIYFIYAITIAYIHVNVFKSKMFFLYEDIMVKLSVLSLIIWLFTNMIPDTAMKIASLFPQTSHGYNFIYLVHWINPSGRHVEYGLIRNAGCSWEPGRFAIMLCLAIMMNIYRKGVSFRKNKNVVVLLITLLTTMSTTGYVMIFVIYSYMFIKNIFSKYTLFFLIITLPLAYWGMQLNFIGEKLEKSLKVEEIMEHIEDSYSWSEENADGSIAYSMDRFPSFFFEYENFTHDPIIGYGSLVSDSYFMKTRTTAIGFTGGLMTLFSRYGVFMALFFIYALYMSSQKISSLFHSKKRYGLLLCYIMSMISYPLIWFPIYTAFWFYGLFLNNETRLLKK